MEGLADLLAAQTQAQRKLALMQMQVLVKLLLRSIYIYEGGIRQTV